jgi:drug/metabolite transporter (DMT)-like permease
MSVGASNPTHNENKASLQDGDEEDERYDSGLVTPQLRPKLKAENLPVNNSFLSAPPFRPIRPLSPDTLSNFSAEDFEALRPSHDVHDRRQSLEDATGPESKTFKGRLRKFWIRNLGLGYMLLGQVFGTLMNVTTRILEVEGNDGKGMHPFQILFARMGITFVLASAYMWWRKTPHFPFGAPEVRWWLVARGIAGFCGVFGMYYSLLYLPLADATVLTFLSPGIANWACSKLINEPFSRGEQLGTLISFVGVIFIAKPVSLLGGTGNSATPPATGNGDVAPTNGTEVGAHGADASNFENVTSSQRLMAVGIAMIGVLGSSAVYTAIRAISTRAHPLISVNYFATWCFIVSIVAQTFLPGVGWVLPANLKEWGYLIFLGTCGFAMVSKT